MGQGRPSYEFGPFRLDTSEHVLLRDGHPLPLTPKVFDLLCVLVQNHGHLVEKERLLREVWPDSFVEEGALNRSVSVLRKALGDSRAGQEYIETAPKRGYRFVAPVTVQPRAESESFVHSSGRLDVGAAATHTHTPSAPKIRVPTAFRSSMRVFGIISSLLIIGAISYAVVGPPERRSAPPARPVPAHRQVTFSGKGRYR